MKSEAQLERTDLELDSVEDALLTTHAKFPLRWRCTFTWGEVLNCIERELVAAIHWRESQ
jgi:hypothetical protein